APLLEGCDLIFCSRPDATRLFGLEGPAEEAVQRLAERTHARIAVMSIGAEGAVAWDGVQLYHQPALPTMIIDRLGAGDGLAAGVLYGWLSGDLRLGLRYGVALAALALSQQGDLIVTTKQEVESLLVGREIILR
ncbi:MAG: PfkB family carbohydrate kinase, partial [Caldilinea sp.]|nr:PfkB family carbohydrate kinase [Caldilinea sp.]MDW8440241.1 PfkB family carbohydrate kinase [Caldilineaceae bacterium]